MVQCGRVRRLVRGPSAWGVCWAVALLLLGGAAGAGEERWSVCVTLVVQADVELLGSSGSDPVRLALPEGWLVMEGVCRGERPRTWHLLHEVDVRSGSVGSRHEWSRSPITPVVPSGVHAGLLQVGVELRSWAELVSLTQWLAEQAEALARELYGSRP